ncbi:MAG: phycobilisome rod-core linker polypeptide, partial [Leptolyngbyaceae cyanobacterium T60_A2020_046]|nr:phycobilisome rod-core linker polypeptide [Leptolyngbyaceae cyanobacterium T60_A2020_046]
MALPQLTYEPTSQNQRVQGFEVPGDEQPRMLCMDTLLDGSEVEVVVRAAYRQIFNEQQLLASNRLPRLESQLKAGQITMRDFIRGLLTSSTFQDRNYAPNNNYRVVRMCVQRVLGREVYSDREVMSWSVVLATQGLHGFVNALLDSDEYLTAFGEHTVPYQRRRILPQRATGDMPFARVPRYSTDHLEQLKALGYDFQRTDLPGQYRWAWQKQPPVVVRQIAGAVTFIG